MYCLSSGTVYVDGVVSNVIPTDGNWHNVIITGITLNINENITIGTRYSIGNSLDGQLSQIGFMELYTNC